MLGIAAGGILLAGALAGCQRNADIIEQNDNTSNQDNIQAKEGDTLTLVSFNNLIKEEFLNAFHEKYPEVELKITSYAGVNGSGYAMYSLKNGDIPDIYITTQGFNEEAQEKYLLDLSNYDFVNNYSTALLDSMDVNGGIYLLPSGYQLTGIYYNKTLMEENNWEVPQSFQELCELSEKIKAAGYQVMGNGMILDGYPFNYFFNIGNTVYFGTPEGTEWKEEFPEGKAGAEENTGLRETVEYFNKWVEKGFITSEHMDTEDFYKGKSIFFLCLGLSEYEYTDESGKTYEFGTIPWLSEDGGNNMLTRTVSRYMGINKALTEKGNEQKLENALKLLQFISTAEGQQALMSSSSQYMTSLNGDTLSPDSPYQEILDLVREGRTVPLVYVGWEDLIIPIAQDIRLLIEGKIDVDELLPLFDETCEDILGGASDDIYAVAAEKLTLEETARLVSIAEGKAASADCALISLNEYHGENKTNTQGLGWYLYPGDVTMEMVNLIRPRSAAISLLEMKGAEIKRLRDGGFDLHADGNPYEYLLYTRGDMELEDDTVYRLAVSTGELPEGMRADAQELEISPAQAIEQYLREIKVVSADALKWE